MPTNLFTTLLTASRTAHRGRQHEVAYHALTAAMHAAVDDNNLEHLREISQEARTQLDELDTREPDHRLGTKSAGGRGHPGVYRMLIRDVDAHVQMLGRHTS